MGFVTLMPEVLYNQPKMKCLFPTSVPAFSDTVYIIKKYLPRQKKKKEKNYIKMIVCI